LIVEYLKKIYISLKFKVNTIETRPRYSKMNMIQQSYSVGKQENNSGEDVKFISNVLLFGEVTYEYFEAHLGPWFSISSMNMSDTFHFPNIQVYCTRLEWSQTLEKQ